MVINPPSSAKVLISENRICITEVVGIYMNAYGQIELILLCFYCLSIISNVKWNNGEE